MKHPSTSIQTALCLLAAAGWLCAPAAWAQQAAAPAAAPKAPLGVNLDLTDGRQIVATGFRLDGATLLATQRVENGTGEIGYALASVRKIEFPDPAQIAGATALLASGKAAEALAQIDPIVAYYAPFRAIPGNWWLPAALLKTDALTALRRDREADALLAEIAKLPSNPAAAEAARVRTAEAQTRQGNAKPAEAAFDELIRTSSDPDILARAWAGKGRLLLAARDYEPALLASLHVPVFYPEDRTAMPPALLAGGRAFVGIDKRDQARKTFQQLVTDYPSSPEAGEARTELQKLAAASGAAEP